MVEISDSVWRRWREADEDAIGLVVKSALPMDEAMPLVQRALASMDWQAPEEHYTVGIVEVQETTKGPGLYVEALPEHFRLLLTRLTAELDRTDLFDATIAPMSVATPFRGAGHDVGYLKVYMSLRGQYSDEWDAPEKIRSRAQYWDVTPTDVADTVDYLVDWALDLPGADKWIVATGRYPTQVPAGMVRPLARSAARGRDDRLAIDHVYVFARDRFRFVDLLPGYGTVAASEGNQHWEKFDWPTANDSTTALLREAGPWCTYGHVTRGHAVTAMSALDPEGGQLKASANWLTRTTLHRQLIENGQLFDAFPVMRLNRQLAQTLPLEPTWQFSTTADPDYAMAIHSHLDDWFAEPEIKLPTIETARTLLAQRIAPGRGSEVRDTWALTRRGPSRNSNR